MWPHSARLAAGSLPSSSLLHPSSLSPRRTLSSTSRHAWTAHAAPPRPWSLRTMRHGRGMYSLCLNPEGAQRPSPFCLVNITVLLQLLEPPPPAYEPQQHHVHVRCALLVVRCCVAADGKHHRHLQRHLEDLEAVGDVGGRAEGRPAISNGEAAPASPMVVRARKCAAERRRRGPPPAVRAGCRRWAHPALGARTCICGNRRRQGVVEKRGRCCLFSTLLRAASPH